MIVPQLYCGMDLWVILKIQNFSLGSSEIAKYIANRGDKIFSVVGGGDTVAVINSLNINNKFNFVSTAGGAFLEYLEGKVLPGIKALN